MLKQIGTLVMTLISRSMQPFQRLYGVSRFLFSALALAVVFTLFASYFVALTVVPLFCAKFIKKPHGHDVAGHKKSFSSRFNGWRANRSSRHAAA